MSAQDMDRMRSNIRVDQSERLRLIIGRAGATLGMECSECEDLLEWVPDKKWWICDCGLETTPLEARVLMEQARAALDTQVVDLGGRRLGEKEGFWTWLKEKLRLRGRMALPKNSDP